MNATEFKVAMASLPEPPDLGETPPHWSFWRRQLWELSQSDDVSNFLSWQPIYATMLVDHFPIEPSLNYLKQDWDRWQWAVKGSGDERDYRNRINQCAHLKLFEETVGKRVDELEVIAEFGGGYGAMALVCQSLGFRGTYVIHDLPEFRILQQWWLSQRWVDGVNFVWSDAPHQADLLIGIYSISEIPPSERNQWLVSDRYLLLCSSQFDKWDNLKFMRKVVEARPGMNWHEEQKEQRPDHYLIGWPK